MNGIGEILLAFVLLGSVFIGFVKACEELGEHTEKGDRNGKEKN